jgi:hypothetical protein
LHPSLFSEKLEQNVRLLASSKSTIEFKTALQRMPLNSLDAYLYQDNNKTNQRQPQRMMYNKKAEDAIQ